MIRGHQNLYKDINYEDVNSTEPAQECVQWWVSMSTEMKFRSLLADKE